MNMMYADTIEWWENEQGQFNWHALSDENGNILFGSVQGYSDKATLLRYVSQQFPDATIRERPSPEPESGVTAEAVSEEPVSEPSIDEDDGA